MKRKIKIALLSLALLVFITGCTTYLLAYLYEDEAIDYIVNKGLNRYLNTEVSVGKTELSFFKSFPYASIQFSNVVCKSSKGLLKIDFPNTNIDTLFEAKKLFLEFNVLDLLSKKYTLRNIKLIEGKLNIFIDSNGLNNFQLLKENKSQASGSFNLRLKIVRLYSMNLKIIDQSKKFTDISILKTLKLSGNLSEKEYALTINAEIWHQNLFLNNKDYFTNQLLQIDFSTQVKNKIISFKNGSLNIGQLKLLLNGNLSFKPNIQADLILGAKNQKIEKLYALASSLINNNLKKTPEGSITFIITYKQNASNTNPHIEAKFTIENGRYTFNQNYEQINNIALKGFYTNGKSNTFSSSSLFLKDLVAEINHSRINAEGSIVNLKTPLYHFSGLANIDLSELKSFVVSDTFDVLEGNAQVKFMLSGKIKSFDSLNIRDLFNNETKAKIKLDNAAFRLKNSQLEIKKMNGLLAIDKNVTIEGLNFLLNGNDFLLNGTALNVVNFLQIDSQALNINGSLSCSNLNFDNYKRKGSNKEEKPFIISFPENVFCDFSFSVGNFKYDDFEASKIRCILNYKPGFLSLRSLTMNSMNGSLSGGGAIIKKLNKDLAIQFQLKYANINIDAMFNSFNNFGQQFLMAKHLRGSLEGNCMLTSEWTQELNIIPEKLNVEGSFTIKNGELKNFEPLLGLSKFAKISELKDIKFSTLKNDFCIKNKTIIIPQMDINSSAFDLSGSGIHNFDNHFSYRVKLLLSQVLFKKASNAKKENDEFGEIEDDGLGKTSLYFTIEGTPNDYKVRYDSRKAKDVIVEKLKNEKNVLKQLFHDEFGFFKSDSSLNKHLEIKNKKSRFEWEDEEEKSNNINTVKIMQNDNIKVEWKDDPE